MDNDEFSERNDTFTKAGDHEKKKKICVIVKGINEYDGVIKHMT